MKLTMDDMGELPRVASEILQFAGSIRIVAFRGEIGAGKTTLIKQICSQLGGKEAVVSPTFGLVNSYQGQNEQVHHFDWYRIKHEEEATEIGWEEYLDSGEWLFVEWPEKIVNLLPEELMIVNIEVLSDGKRVLDIQKLLYV